MKKLLMILVVGVCFVSCGNNEQVKTEPLSQQTEKVLTSPIDDPKLAPRP